MGEGEGPDVSPVMTFSADAVGVDVIIDTDGIHYQKPATEVPHHIDLHCPKCDRCLAALAPVIRDSDDHSVGAPVFKAWTVFPCGHVIYVRDYTLWMTPDHAEFRANTES